MLLVLLTAVNLMLGSVSYSLSELFGILSHGNGTDNMVILKIRLPRTLAVILLGGALSLSGLLLQNFFANPIAGPFVLGISSGAKFAVSIAMTVSLSVGTAISSSGLVITAFIGSLAAMGTVLAISGRVKRMSVLIVAGVMNGYICSALTELVISFADDSDIVNLHGWSVGTFSGTDMDEVKIMAVVVIPALLLTFMLSKPMGAYQLGEAYASNMGVNIKKFRAELIVLSSLLSACVTAFAGPVSFVGSAVPHMVRGMLGTSKPIVIIPASFLGGAVFCLFCDLMARVLFAPSELGISTITAIFGAPVVVTIMLRRGDRQL